MISFCSTLIHKNLQDYLDILTDTLCRHSQHVKEAILVQTDEPEGLLKTWTKKGIEFKHYGCDPIITPRSPAWEKMICGHARGLHKAISLAQQEYVWLSDPDVFFLSDVDQTYLDLFVKHDLDLIGVSHFNPLGQSYLYCPCVINCMAKQEFFKTEEEFFAQTTIREGAEIVCSVGPRWLIPGPPLEYKNYPNPTGIFDTGCRLWQRSTKWISFYLDLPKSDKNTGFSEINYPLNYTTHNYKSNFELIDDLGDKELLYHRTRGSKAKISSYKDLYWSLQSKSISQSS